jgi:hypothetical protein
LLAVFGTIILQTIKDFFPDYFLGITILLWGGYASTIILDWITGIQASKAVARRKGQPFVWDREKALTSWSKHALFIIIMAFIYHLQTEAVRTGFSEYVTDALTGAQFLFFSYSMITEFISIEDNRFVITQKQSRFAKLFLTILDAFDSGIIRKVNKTFDNENNKPNEPTDEAVS